MFNSFILNILIFLWLLRTIKFALFWIYLWQLKDYHIGRLRDHFRTEKGKQIFLNRLFVIKIFLLILLLISYAFFPFVFYMLIVLYIAESLVFLIGALRGRVRRPKLTMKTAWLMLVSFFLVGTFLVKATSLDEFSTVASLLLFDLFLPVIVSAVVLVFQPVFVLLRNSVIKKATRKMEEIKTKNPKLVVIGITGSYGKTSTKEFLRMLLADKFDVVATPDHQNSEIGISQCVLRDITKETEVFIVEMGAYGKGGIALLADIVKPRIGMVTGVNEQHLATFKTMDNLLSAEGGRELLAKLPKDGVLVVNGDNKYCLDLYKKAEIEKRIYTAKGDRVNSDLYAQEISVHKDSVSFVAMTQNHEAMPVRIKALGEQHVQNLLGAMLVAKEMGMTIEEISQASQRISHKHAGSTLKTGIHGIEVIDSSYSANPDGVAADLQYLSIFPRKKVIVMPCLIELGKRSAYAHEEIGAKIAKVCDMAIITTKDRFLDIKKGAMDNGMEEKKIIYSENPKEIFNRITTYCKEGDAVLLEGRVPSQLIKLLGKK